MSAEPTDFNTIDPGTFMVEGIVGTACGWGKDTESGETVRSIDVVLLGGPPSIHSGEPSKPLKLMMDEETAANLRLVLDHSKCPGWGQAEGEPT